MSEKIIVPDIIIDESEESKSVKGLSACVQGFVSIENKEEYVNCAELLKNVKGIMKQLEEKEDFLKKPLNEARKRIIDFFKPNKLILEGLEKKLKAAMQHWDFKQEQVRVKKEAELLAKKNKEIAELNKKLKAEKDKGIKEEIKNNLEMIKSMDVIVPSESVAVDGIQKKKRWTAIIKNVALIPNPYMLVNQPMLNEIAVTKHDTFPIPGVEFKEIEYIASSSN